MSERLTKSKPDIILLHGLRGAPIGLQGIKEKLEDHGYTVHTPAVPPYAGADFDDRHIKSYRPQDYANYIATWIKTHQLDHPILIGHSMGTLVASSVAKYHSELIDNRLILLSPISARASLPFRVISPLADLVPPRIVDYATTRYLAAGHNRKIFKQTMKITHVCSGQSKGVSKKQLQKATKFSVTYGINDILSDEQPLTTKTPHIYIIAGTKDRLVNHKTTKKLAKKLDAKTYFLKDTGHLHNYEKPAETAELIAKILAEP